LIFSDSGVEGNRAMSIKTGISNLLTTAMTDFEAN